MKLLRILPCVVGLLFTALPLVGGDSVAIRSGPTTAIVAAYGTAAESSAGISALAFSRFDASATWNTTISLERYATVTTFPGAGFFAGLQLPNGALITGLELRACDTSSSEIEAYLFSSVAAEPSNISTRISGATSGTPGCGLFRFNPAAPFQVNNETSSYSVAVTTLSGTSATRFSGVRVFYRLQVSPAPETNTYSDVPAGHIFFKFVEALAASGVTSGCGGGRFCVDGAITRGEAAVWLTTALGMHFPN